MDESGRSREDEWFRQNERKLIEDAQRGRAKREAERTARETVEHLRQLKERHFMKCPKCGHDLATEKLEGVDIERCTFCEGLYLDAGELEKLFLHRTQGERRSIFRKLVGI